MGSINKTDLKGIVGRWKTITPTIFMRQNKKDGFWLSVEADFCYNE
jgi:hypothetical protein